MANASNVEPQKNGGSEPSSKGADPVSTVGGSISAAFGMLGVIAAIAAGAGKIARHGGGDLARGVGDAPNLIRNLDDAPGQVPRFVPGQTDELLLRRPRRDPNMPYDLPDPRGNPDRPSQGIEVQDIDVQGLLNDAKELVAQDLQDERPYKRLLEEEGLELLITFHTNCEEYAGRAGEELDAVRQESDIEAVLRIGRTEIERSREAGDLPDKQIGEYSRCSVRFNDEGKPILRLTSRTRIEGIPAPIVWEGSYELVVRDGSEEDFVNHKPVKFCYSEAGLKSLREDAEKRLESTYREAFKARYADIPDLQELGPRTKVTASLEELPNADIIATPSSCILRDQAKTVARLVVSYPAK